MGGQYSRMAALHRRDLSSRHLVWQPKREVRPENDERQHPEHRQVKRNGAEDDFAQLAVPNALNDEQIDPDRRRNLTKLDEQDQDDAEQERVDAVTGQHWKDQRYRDHDHAQAFDQTAEHGVKNEQRQEKLQPAQLQPHDKCRHLLSDAGEADSIGKYIGGEDDEQNIS